MTDTVNRRRMLGGMIALHALALARIAQAQTPLPAQSGPVDQDGFMALSRRITGHDDLSPVLGARILSVLNDAGQAAPLQEMYAALSQDAAQGEPPDSDMLRVILHGWYLGRVTIEDQTYLTGFEETLMGRVTADILPLRSYCGGAMGFWADPPIIGPVPLREADQ